MIAITKAEADYIREKYPNVHIVRTMKQKSKRHRYYCEEARPVMRYLSKTRNTEYGESKREDGKHFGNRKKTKRESR